MGAAELRLIGEADLGTRDRFGTVIREALAASAASGVLTLDMRLLCFMDGACAADLLRCVARTCHHERIEVLRLLRRLGAAGNRRLVLSETIAAC